MNEPEDDLTWLGIDLDRTVAQNSPHPEYALLDPIPGAREAMESLYLFGWHLVIYTARPWHDYDKICEWLEKHQIPYDQVVCGKLFCKYMIDDRNIAFRGDWGEVLEQIK